ncbi:hypothetical protein [Sporisorium scitamineum]|uniref:Uncharacterized protein n=1 Tax=Sporisorium scitamineum TaxID=49012 RepID=A0A0F7RWY2_9BASI|nr:hypothetical protein [Sporisorium scitamineum]
MMTMVKMTDLDDHASVAAASAALFNYTLARSRSLGHFRLSA